MPALRAPYDRVAPSPRFSSPRVRPFSRHMRRATPSRRAWPPNSPVGRLLSRSRIFLVAFFVPSAHPFSLAAVRGKLRPLPWLTAAARSHRAREARRLEGPLTMSPRSPTFLSFLPVCGCAFPSFPEGHGWQRVRRMMYDVGWLSSCRACGGSLARLVYATYMLRGVWC